MASLGLDCWPVEWLIKRGVLCAEFGVFWCWAFGGKRTGSALKEYLPVRATDDGSVWSEQTWGPSPRLSSKSCKRFQRSIRVGLCKSYCMVDISSRAHATNKSVVGRIKRRNEKLATE